jgi:dihydrofolate reductase
VIYLIAAVGRQGQIGLNGRLPWRDSEDLKWFKDQTMRKVVVCGFNTAQHLPPLPGRTLHVLQRGETPEHVIKRYAGVDIWVIGGAKTYQQWIPYVDRCLVSLIDYDGPADAWFPPIIPGVQP